ncbi:hypothetical protein GH5_03156 [Leishmania sp. Ghana 2012 LV757]|uniref:hypothetical protein n=1 Tax=Leishmania sp. Ghana 2012 LV757 TaxID=2803181 RepID=UPI001B409A4B|nr:hypothetical protein GH5_03156 [Leishmania sp. Ghana 2012 LV757]
MLQEVGRLFFAPSRSNEHRRWRQAAISFTVLWVVSIVFTITTSFIIASVLALVLLNIAASLTAAVVTQSLCSRGGTQQSYPFGFGMYRLSVVVRLGSIIFLVFGCATTTAECLHSGIHDHHSNPLFLFMLGVAQLLSQVVFRRYVRLADRVTGHRGMAGAQSEDIIYLSATACSDGRSMRGGSLFDELRKPLVASVASQSPSSSPVQHGTPRDAHRTVHSKSSAIFVYLLCPITCVIASVLMAVMDSTAPDVIGALLLAAYYAYVGYQNGRDMAGLLMNKCVTDPRRLRSLERCLRNIKALDGVLLVESTVWWNVNVSESMLLIRIRLVSGAEGCVVSRSVRQQLAELATYVYVECFPAIGANDRGESDQLSWCAPLMSTHGHCHSAHGNCHDDHSHSRENRHSSDHVHSHDRGCNDSDHHNHDHHYSHGNLSAACGEITVSVRGCTNESANVKSDLQSGYVGAALPSSAQGFPRAVSSTAGTGAAPGSLSFPAPPGLFSGECDPSTERQRPLSGVSPADSGSSGHALSTAYGAVCSAAAVTGAPSPSTGLSHVASSPYIESSMTADIRFGQPEVRGAAGRAAHSISFPVASSPRLPDVPPPVFTPFREHGGHVVSEARRGASQGSASEHV